MARLNISIPDELKARMDTLNVNWSAIAAEAFAIEVRKAQRITDMEQTAVVDRLRASFQKSVKLQEEEGHKAGVAWASNNAEAADLIYLSRFDDPDDAGAWLLTGSYADTPFEPYDSAPWFFEAATGLDRRPSKAFAAGFATGALEVWEAVGDDVVE